LSLSALNSYIFNYSETPTLLAKGSVFRAVLFEWMAGDISIWEYLFFLISAANLTYTDYQILEVWNFMFNR
jgi:hypothetical protein